MNSSITFRDAKLFGMAMTLLALEAAPSYSGDEETLTIDSEDVLTIKALLNDNGIFNFTVEGLDEDERDQFRTDGEADADALASAGFGTDEDYGSASEHVSTMSEPHQIVPNGQETLPPVTSRTLRCPRCLSSWDGGPIPEKYHEHYSPPYRWSKLIGIEIQGLYDGIHHWQCPCCNTTFPRYHESADGVALTRMFHDEAHRVTGYKTVGERFACS